MSVCMRRCSFPFLVAVRNVIVGGVDRLDDGDSGRLNAVALARGDHLLLRHVVRRNQLLDRPQQMHEQNDCGTTRQPAEHIGGLCRHTCEGTASYDDVSVDLIPIVGFESKQNEEEQDRYEGNPQVQLQTSRLCHLIAFCNGLEICATLNLTQKQS